MKKEIQKTSLSAIFSALIVVLTLLGTFLDVLDITVSAICALAVSIVQFEAKGKYPFLVYLTSSVLCLVFAPLSTATLYFIGFFGYYPIIKLLLVKKSRKVRKFVCSAVFNVAMIVLFLLFKAVFALQNESFWMYIALLVTVNIFFICFDYLHDVFAFIYFKKLRSKIKFIK